MTQMKSLTKLFLFCTFPVVVLGGFVQPVCFGGSRIRTTNGQHAFYMTTRRGVNDDDIDEDGVVAAYAGSRRDLIQSCASVAFLTVAVVGGNSAMAEAATTAAPSTEEDLMFEQFAKSLHTGGSSSVTTGSTPEPQRWPASPSPLPTAKKNAAELTMPDNSPPALTLEDAMKEASKKKNVGPRTHG
mmetsp:Transcript_22596/g.40781  ORF Transcript_22596/g.40781 Transcript_22596/m.40781 type:complete len:186 (-) Transcript_22596:214-771(-)